MTQQALTRQRLVGELSPATPRTPETPGRWLAALARVVDACSPFGEVFPAVNGAALGSYYLGVLALVPLFGALPAPAAVALGWRGLRRAPAVGGRGTAHAAFGLAVGALAGAANLAWAVVWLSLAT